MCFAPMAWRIAAFAAADHIDDADAVGNTELVEHLAKVGRGGRVHQGRVPFQSHRREHAERGHRVDEG
jgi:hypothetical protein